MPTSSTKQALRIYTTKTKRTFQSKALKATPSSSLSNVGAPVTATIADVDEVEYLGAALASVDIGAAQQNVAAALPRAPFNESTSNDEDAEMLSLQAFLIQFKTANADCESAVTCES